jgi:hypothetical protein
MLPANAAHGTCGIIFDVDCDTRVLPLDFISHEINVQLITPRRFGFEFKRHCDDTNARPYSGAFSKMIKVMFIDIVPISRPRDDLFSLAFFNESIEIWSHVRNFSKIPLASKINFIGREKKPRLKPKVYNGFAI